MNPALGVFFLFSNLIKAVFFYLLREGFKFNEKKSGEQNIILENDVIKVEFDSLRGLLKVSLLHNALSIPS